MKMMTYVLEDEMLKKIKALMFALTIFFALAGMTQATPVDRTQEKEQAVKSRLAVTLNGGFGMNQLGSEKPGNLNGKGVTAGIGVQYFLMRNLGLEFSGFYFANDSEGIAQSISAGKLNSMPLQLNLVGRFFLGKSIAFNLLAGANYTMNSFSVSPEVKTQWDTVGMSIEEKVNSKVGYQAGFGADIYLGRSLTFGIDARYFLAKGSGTYKLTDQKTNLSVSGPFSGFNLDFFCAQFSIKFFLK